MNVCSKVMGAVRNSDVPAVQAFYKQYLKVRKFAHNWSDVLYLPAYCCFKLLPKQDKLVASAYQGRKYGDNLQYIIEELHEMNPDVEIVWLVNGQFHYDLPPYVRGASFDRRLRRAYEFATAKVWISTHRMDLAARKTRQQLFIETWHGGLGLKRVANDVEKSHGDRAGEAEIKNTSQLADIFVSNSDHLTAIYRGGFGYKGKIWKCGYPKNDLLVNGKPGCKEKVCAEYGIDPDSKLLVYAPTFRDSFYQKGFVRETYDIDFDELQKTMEASWGGKWVILLRWHPVMINEMKKYGHYYGNKVVDATEYPDMQELILAADAFISDYSSCIFDAAIREIPCFTFATDFEEYKGDRGVYYEMEELPFPYAKDNRELMENVRTFDYDAYLQKWNAFKARTGLHETGHAAKDIAYVINEFIKGNRKPLEEIKSEP